MRLPEDSTIRTYASTAVYGREVFGSVELGRIGNDELRRLSETLNSMLYRIEVSVTRLKQFTADASHELRAPVTLIQAAAEYTLRRERSRS